MFKAATDIVPIDVYPRDAKGQFIPNLTIADFQIFEDGVEQKILNVATVNGGRIYGDLASTSAVPTSEGLVLPKTRPPADVAGRIFIVFIDDLHLMPAQTPSVRKLLMEIRDTVVHDNDLIGFVSSGFSSVALDPAYDYGHRRFNEVINKVMGSGPTIMDMITMQAGGDGLAELNHNVNVAFSTAYDLLTQLEDIHGKRKAFIWVSNGYTLDPFKDSRLRKAQQQYMDSGGCDQAQTNSDGTTSTETPKTGPCAALPQGGGETTDTTQAEYHDDPFGGHTMEFKPAQLISQLAELIASANRANVMFFPVDPRGLIATLNDASMQSPLSYQEQRDYVEGTTSTLKVLAEQTGGVACVNMNDCKPVLQIIDNMTSDYYMIGYRSSNPDPMRLRRRVEVRVNKPGVKLVPERDYRAYYQLKRVAKKGK